MPIPAADLQRWQHFADAVLPGTVLGPQLTVEVGGSHRVLVIAGVAVIRAARTAEAATLMGRRLRLLERLGTLPLPFAVPSPLSDAVVVEGTTVSAVSWLAGTPQGRGAVTQAELQRLWVAMRSVDVDALVDVLDVPHAYAGRDGWASLMLEEVVPRLPVDVQEESLRRVEAAAALPAVTPGLVHGDLAGANLLWNNDGGLSGVLDWDLACAFDPAVDAACLAWFGWPAVAAIVDERAYLRARTWFGVFGLEQVSAALLDSRPQGAVDELVARTAQWIRRTPLLGDA